MKGFINKIFVIAILGVGLVACSKEEVKPFAAGGPADINNLGTKGAAAGNVNQAEAKVDEQQTLRSDEETDVVNEETGSGITDGGTSSDYDSKGTKRKPGKN